MQSIPSTSAWNWNFKLVLFLFRTGGYGTKTFYSQNTSIIKLAEDSIDLKVNAAIKGRRKLLTAVQDGIGKRRKTSLARKG
jgi:hypothetical protein